MTGVGTSSARRFATCSPSWRCCERKVRTRENRTRTSRRAAAVEYRQSPSPKLELELLSERMEYNALLRKYEELQATLTRGTYHPIPSGPAKPDLSHIKPPSTAPAAQSMMEDTWDHLPGCYMITRVQPCNCRERRRQMKTIICRIQEVRAYVSDQLRDVAGSSSYIMQLDSIAQDVADILERCLACIK
jgi:hypothetical protein